MTDYSEDEDPGGPNTGSPWHFFIWKPPSLSWVFSSNDSHYNKISKPDGSNHQSLKCVSQSSKQHNLEPAHSIDYCRRAIDGSCAPVGQHVCTGHHQYSTPTQSCTVSSEAGQPWHDIERHTEHAPQNTSALTQTSHIYPSSQHDSGDLGKALDKLGNGDQLLVGRIILPTNWRYVFTSHKHHQDLLELLDDALISLDSASFAPFARMAALLEKAILRTSFSQRYIGLYPHSADPPIHTKEKIPEPPKRLTIHRAHHQRPVRSKKNQLHSQPSSTRSLLAYLLHLARAFTSIFIAFPFFYRVVYQNKTLNIKRPHLELYIGKMEFPYIFDQIDPEWLKSFAEEDVPEYLPFDIDQFPLDTPATYHHPVITQSSPIPSDTDSAYPIYSYPLGYPLQRQHSNQFSPFSPNSTDSLVDPTMDSPGFDISEFVTLPPASPLPAPTPAPREVEEEDIQLQSEDTLPGPATTATILGSVSPQTEGLATPTFTPLGSSPETVASPHPNAHSCPEESCGHKRFNRRCDLHKHLKTHRKDLKCQYPGCDKCFSTEKDRRRHDSTVHQREKPFLCHLCDGGKAFSRQDNLKDHKRRIHGA